MLRYGQETTKDSFPPVPTQKLFLISILLGRTFAAQSTPEQTAIHALEQAEAAVHQANVQNFEAQITAQQAQVLASEAHGVSAGGADFCGAASGAIPGPR